ncbi:MAG: hypothetical protein MMC33_007716 [Icmadophila ericetorum]|nr:hypothetical protein [Icmadophila ericetorum]
MSSEATSTEPASAGKFTPKQPVQLNPPKDDPFTTEELAKCDGSDSSRPTCVAIKGTVFDVTGNSAYKEGGAYRVFAGHDASRALAKSSLKAEDISPEFENLDEKEKKVLDDWFAFFSKRYNILGKVVNL